MIQMYDGHKMREISDPFDGNSECGQLNNKF